MVSVWFFVAVSRLDANVKALYKKPPVADRRKRAVVRIDAKEKMSYKESTTVKDQYDKKKTPVGDRL